MDLKLSVSNIAWEREQQAEVVGVLRECGVDGVEVALTKIAPWDALTEVELGTEREALADAGLMVSSYQALYFGKPELQLLGDDASFAGMMAHTVEVARHAACLSGGGVGVFGAPKNRLRGNLSPEEAFDLGRERFRALAEAIAPFDFRLALEPAPSEYGGDFLEDMPSCLEMVESVEHPSLGLHLDTGCLELRSFVVADDFDRYVDRMIHAHASRPFLHPLDHDLPEAAIAALQALARSEYEGWLAIEMRATDQPVETIRRAVKAVRGAIGPV